MYRTAQWLRTTHYLSLDHWFDTQSVQLNLPMIQLNKLNLSKYMCNKALQISSLIEQAVFLKNSQHFEYLK